MDQNHTDLHNLVKYQSMIFMMIDFYSIQVIDQFNEENIKHISLSLQTIMD